MNLSVAENEAFGLQPEGSGRHVDNKFDNFSHSV